MRVQTCALHVHMRLQTCADELERVRVQVCADSCVCMCIRSGLFFGSCCCSHTRVRAHTHLHTHANTHIHTHIHAHTHTDTHTRARTHTHRRMQAWRARYPGWLRSSLDLKQLYCSPTRLPCNCASRSANIRSNKRGKVFLKSQYPSTSTMYNHHNENFQELVPRAPVQDT